MATRSKSKKDVEMEKEEEEEKNDEEMMEDESEEVINTSSKRKPVGIKKGISKSEKKESEVPAVGSKRTRKGKKKDEDEEEEGESESNEDGVVKKRRVSKEKS